MSTLTPDEEVVHLSLSMQAFLEMGAEATNSAEARLATSDVSTQMAKAALLVRDAALAGISEGHMLAHDQTADVDAEVACETIATPSDDGEPQHPVEHL
jgi:hypothetical protein